MFFYLNVTMADRIMGSLL